MQAWIISVMEQFGYFGVAFLIAIENVFPPIPSEVILTFGGFMTTHTSLNVWLVALFATIGSVAGAVVLYLVGRLLDRQRLEKLLSGRLGRALHFKAGDVARAEQWFLKRGKLTVFFCRFIPIVRSLISIPAGMSKMNMPVFLLLTTIGTAIWNIVLVWLGAWAGDSWEIIVKYTDGYTKAAIVIIGVAVVAAALIWLWRRRQKSAEDDSKA